LAAKKKDSNSGTGLNKSTAGAISYVLGPVTGVLFLLIDKDPFVQFHAMQSIVVFTSLVLLQWVLGLTIILLPLVPIVGLIVFVLWLVLIYKAWQGDKWKVPLLGNFSENLLKKM
jgi:uncharacterized membrane protein